MASPEGDPAHGAASVPTPPAERIGTRFGIIASQGGVDDAIALAEDAEAHGWDGFFTWDGISVGPSQPSFDPFSLLGAVAQRTRSLTLGAMVFAPARRRPLTFAQQVATVDHLSGGRLVVPVGLGAPDDAGFARVSGEADSARGRAELLDESLAILDLASTGETFSYRGDHHELSDVVLVPRPVQRPRVPVWVVGAWPSERSMRRAARWDGVVLQLRRAFEEPTPEQVAEAVSWLGEERERLRADGVALGARFDVVVSGRLPEDATAAAARIDGLAAAGATWWVEAWWGPTDTAAALQERVRRRPPARRGGGVRCPAEAAGFGVPLRPRGPVSRRGGGVRCPAEAAGPGVPTGVSVVGRRVTIWTSTQVSSDFRLRLAAIRTAVLAS